MSDAEIQERLARFANGGGRSGGGEAGGRLRGGSTEYYVLTDSGDPEKPNEVTVKTGMSDGSHTEIVEGLEVGDEVLVQRVSLGGGRSGGNNPFMPSFGGRRR